MTQTNGRQQAPIGEPWFPSDPSKEVSQIWLEYLDELLRNPLNIKTASTRVGADEVTIVLDGTSEAVTLTMPTAPTAGKILAIACIDSTFTVTIDLNGKNFYSTGTDIVMVAEEYYYFQFDGTQWVGFKGTSSGGVTEFTGLTDTPSSYVGEAGKTVKVNVGETALEFVVNSALGLDHLTDLANVGTNTHAQIDTAVTASTNHIADATIHFTEASIDHTNITNIGTNTHAQIDTHIATTNIHVPDSSLVTKEYDEAVPTFVSNLETQRVHKLASSTVETFTYTYDANNRPATATNGVNTWTLTHGGNGFLTGVVKT